MLRPLHPSRTGRPRKRAPSVVYVDSWRILDGRDGRYKGGLRQPDGVHLTPSGSFQLADAVYAIIEKDWHIRRSDRRGGEPRWPFPEDS